jgi:hypothetical protein
LREALQRHLAESGFPVDLGNGEKWVTVRLGPIPICLPNLPIRQKAMLRHDLNHVVSGYGHDLIGESEVGAWEIGGGCDGYPAAWVLAWSIILPGAVIAPKRVFSAFVRGRRTGNLFTTDVQAVLDEQVGDVQRRLGLDRSYRWSMKDLVFFTVVVSMAPVVGAIPFALSVITCPMWISQRAYRHRR